ncbi:L-piperidine-6-carboxylate dehydrogenase [Vibrio nitrifigilis]|uniref:aldehyde dehydrogenase (NAD(+)) n=1 Tax=Vibrio nitrifigilis TaxID=2789781 RepID=A0ABS0GM39_9VIBR|nr:aldehyde dehydrogenase family protein [Vibrio nitrifigilis]MBF9003289.1 aldehyde dehydrogenase family protein [Vibrio nitrifigilis]
MTMEFMDELGLSAFICGEYYPSIVSGAKTLLGQGAQHDCTSPIDGTKTARFQLATPEQLNAQTERACAAFKIWRNTPAPVRGQFVRRIGELARQYKTQLAQVITLEAGKILPEALGEVQEWIDVCDFAVGLSRQLHGLTIASERPGHRMMEQWHPLGPVAVISAYNFPMAVWSWNAMLGLVCGDAIVWKPSEKSPLCALAIQTIVNRALDEMPDVPKDIVSVIIGGGEIGKAMSQDQRYPLVSATGSTRMGKSVGEAVGARLGRSLLELGGNNAMIVSEHADLDLALRAIVFAAVGTAGQRCTSLRRVIVHHSVKQALCEKLVQAYQSLRIGDPRSEHILVGPLIDEMSYATMQAALTDAKQQGGTVLIGGERVTEKVPEGGFYVTPSIVDIAANAAIVQQETFAPILYVMSYENIEQAIDIQNDVPQGLSSAIFTENLKEAELFLSPSGSDCGLANVNIGTSGAEIGGAFGGEKETGGGRESGSDAWKNYMRRSTNTINYGGELPLAQGIVFE